MAVLSPRAFSVDVLARHGPRIGVVLLDRRASEADEQDVQQGIAEACGEDVGHLASVFIHSAAQPILAAIRI